MKYWLIKSEGSCYSIDDLQRDRKTAWTGVRNYQARNFMQSMTVGDMVLFYHSNGDKVNPTGVYGIATVCSKPKPDHSQFDKTDDHYDGKATREKPIWYCVDMKFVSRFKNRVTLSEIKFDPKLSGMMVTQTGSRLSVQPVSEKHFKYIVSLVK